MAAAGVGPMTRAEGFNCPNCGAGIALRAHGFAETVACTSCGSVLDATDPNLSILQRHTTRMREGEIRIPLGTRGTWRGLTWESIGYQIVTITVDGVDYSWSEYVLFNPYSGFMYLSEYQGHWNVIEKLRRRPRTDRASNGRSIAVLDGTPFKHFQTATARTTFAAGEFPWELRVGDQIAARDYVSPPYILSAEASEGETTWSLGTYTPAKIIEKAFGVEDLPRPRGVFANQPNPHTARAGAAAKACLVFLAALLLMLVLNVVMARRELVTEVTRRFDRAVTPSAWIAGPFQLDGRPSTLEVEFDTEADNDWAFFVVSLINETTGDVRDAAKQVSYYSGTDSDGRWTEGSRRGKLRFASVPAGRYMLRISEEGGEAGSSTLDYRLRVRRDVPGYGFYVMAFFALVIPALLLWIPAASFEQHRWAESDYGGGSGSDSESGDDDDE